MRKPCRIALVGDYNPSVTAHQAIPLALELASRHHQAAVEGVWVYTSEIDDAETLLTNFDGLWCIPASPYRNMQGALETIRVAREHSIPFLGTCGGFQHALLEHARNVLGLTGADHAESNPSASLPLVVPLTCSLVEKQGEILLTDGSMLARSYGTPQITEGYRCSYGPNPQYADQLFAGELRATAHDPDGDVRGAELSSHPFFAGVLFQPERRALKGELPPLVRDFVGAIVGAKSSENLIN